MNTLVKIIRQLIRAIGYVLVYAKTQKMTSVDKKAEELNCNNNYYLNAEGLRRIVFATDSSLQDAAFQYALQLADKTGSLLDILYAYSEDNGLMYLPELLQPLEESGLDFQVTRRQGDLSYVIGDYCLLRKDVLCVVCSKANNMFNKLEHYRRGLMWLERIGLPSVVLIENSMQASGYN